MSADEGARRLAQHIQSLTDFAYYHVDPPYGHIGATIADSVLQANNKYDTHVTPRIQRILNEWPNTKTVTALLDLLKSIPAVTFLNWKGEDRAERFTAILLLLKSGHVETESDLQTWLTNDANLKKLLGIKGVGLKTVDYLKIMVRERGHCGGFSPQGRCAVRFRRGHKANAMRSEGGDSAIAN